MMKEVPQLEDLLRPIVGAKISGYETRNLVAPGENYGSLMLAVTVHLTDGEDLHLVAKLWPRSEFIRQIFNVMVTYKKEVNFYRTILPALQDFQVRHNCEPITSFAKCFGARFSLDPNSEVIDEGCCLLLENLKPKGYQVVDRMVGFNFACTKFVLRKLATFHALPLAMKIKEPQQFKENIKRFVDEPFFTKDSYPPDILISMMATAAERIKKLRRYSEFADAVKQHAIEQVANFYETSTEEDEPFATLIHNDFWTNNTMILLDASGEITDNCIVDFQTLTYGNPAYDLMFFLFTSVEIPQLYRHFDAFIDFYYECFIEELKQLKVDGLDRFAKDIFLRGIDRSMIGAQIIHCLFMLLPIYTMKEKATDNSELNQDSITDESKLDMEKYFERLQVCVDFFVERGWIKMN